MINFLYLFHFLECGHFCVKYIMKKDEKKLNLNYEKRLMSLALVKRVLSEYYDCVKCLKMTNINDIKKRCITLVRTKKNSLHYVVVERVSKNRVYYYDPMFCFLRRAKINRFNKKWCKCCCFFG